MQKLFDKIDETPKELLGRGEQLETITVKGREFTVRDGKVRPNDENGS